MENREKKLAKNTLILAMGTICTKGMAFVMTPFFIRWLSQNDYGVFDLIITYVALLIPLITLEIGQAAFRFLMNDNENKTEIISITLLFSIVISILFSIVIYFISFFVYSINEILNVFLIYTVSEVFYFNLTMIARGKKQLENYTIANIVYVIIMSISVYVLVYILKLGLQGILLGYAIGYTASNIFLFFKLGCYKELSFSKFNFKKFLEMLKYSVPLIPCDISWWIMNVSDRTIVTIFLGASSNAILAVSNKIPNVCQSFFNVFHLSWQENAIDTLNDVDKGIYYSKIFNKMFKTLSSICILIMSFDFIFFDIIFTPEYFLGYYIVPILLLSIIVSMLAQFLGSIYIANMESKKSAKTTIYAAIVNLVVHFMLIEKIGLYASAMSTLVSYLYLTIIRYIDIKHTIDIEFEKNNICLILILIYFVISTYVNSLIINYINIIISIIVFISLNKNYVIKIFNKIKGR